MIDESGITDIQEIRDRILEDPGLILDDPDLMRGLLKADRRAAGQGDHLEGGPAPGGYQGEPKHH